MFTVKGRELQHMLNMLIMKLIRIKMTLRELLSKYSEEVKEIKSSDVRAFKPGHLWKKQVWEAYAEERQLVYASCYDNRRGIWINKFEKNGELVCVQITAGREGDDAIASIVLDREWLQDLAIENDTEMEEEHNIKYSTALYVDNIGVDITEYVIEEVGGYGTDYDSDDYLIEEILKVEDE